MARLLSLLMIFALTLTNGTAVATAMCQHVDAQAHASARQSLEASIASVALVEEAAAVAANKKAALADAAAVQLAGFLLPSDPTLPLPNAVAVTRPLPADASRLDGLEVGPLLEPPLLA